MQRGDNNDDERVFVDDHDGDDGNAASHTQHGDDDNVGDDDNDAAVAATPRAANGTWPRHARREIALADFLVQVEQLQRREDALRMRRQQEQQEEQQHAHDITALLSPRNNSMSRTSMYSEAAHSVSGDGNDDGDGAAALSAHETPQPLLPWHIALWRLLLGWARYLAIAASLMPGVSIYEANRTQRVVHRYDQSDKDDDSQS